MKLEQASVTWGRNKTGHRPLHGSVAEGDVAPAKLARAEERPKCDSMDGSAACGGQ